MLIVKIKDDNGFHPSEFQGGRSKCWMDGYIEVPKELADTLINSRGFCDLIIEDEVLTNIIPRPDYDQQMVTPILTREDEIEAMLIEQEYKLILFELGVSE